MAEQHGLRLWCNLGGSTSIDGVLELCRKLIDAFPDLSVVLTAARGSDLPSDLPPEFVPANRPLDIPHLVERFVAEHAPSAAVFTGSDQFPAAISACKASGIPMLLLDARGEVRGGVRARLSEFRMGSRLRMFERILAVDAKDAVYFERRGADPARLEVLGPLEPSAPVLPCDEDERDHLAACLATRPVWLATGVPGGEIEMVEAAYRHAARQSHRLLLIIVPAQIRDAQDLANFFEAHGWEAVRRSLGRDPDEEVQVYIGDTDDEAGLWYRLAPVTYLGGTMTGTGTVDPFDPAALGSALIHGPSTYTPFGHLDRLVAAGACRAIVAPTELGTAVSDLLAPDRAAQLAGRAWDVASVGVDVADRAYELIANMLRRRMS